MISAYHDIPRRIIRGIFVDISAGISILRRNLVRFVCVWVIFVLLNTA